LSGEYNKQTKKRAGPLNPQFPTTGLALGPAPARAGPGQESSKTVEGNGNV